MKFRVGDRVRIIKGTRYAYQSSADGTIIEVRPTRWYDVKFDDDSGDGYQDDDLELVEIKNWKEIIEGETR